MASSRRQAETWKKSRPQDAALIEQIARQPVARWMGSWVQNVHGTPANIAYGEQVSRLLGGKHFVIDTSRNGVPGADPRHWCNPRGRALGVAPTTNTGHPLVDAFLWVKVPGESDGTCGGGPPAGTWWAQYALELSRMAARLSGVTP